jgi:hypothetical protein
VIQQAISPWASIGKALRRIVCGVVGSVGRTVTTIPLDTKAAHNQQETERHPLVEFEIDRDAETVVTPAPTEKNPTHADLLGVLESIQREANQARLDRDREVSEWMRWRNGIDAKVANLSEAWGEQGKKYVKVEDQLQELVRASHRIEGMLLKRLYQEAAMGREAEGEIRGIG